MSAQSAHEQSTAHAGAGAEAERLEAEGPEAEGPEAEGPEAEGPEAEASGVVSTVSADASCAQLAETAVNAEADAIDEALESSMDTMELAEMEVTDVQSSSATSSDAEAQAHAQAQAEAELEAEAEAEEAEAEAEAKTKYFCGTSSLFCSVSVTINVRFGSRGSESGLQHLFAAMDRVSCFTSGPTGLIM